MLKTALAAAVALWAGAAHAAFPEKPVTIIVPFAAGGSNDIVARYLGDQLSKIWNQPVVAENMPGAGAAIGSAHVAQAEPDGHTLLIGSVTFTMNPAVQPSLPFDPAKDFKPVAMLGSVPLVLVTGPSTEAKTIQEFLEEAKTKDPKYATSGLGTVNQFGAERLNRAASLKMQPVHYKGGSEAMTDVIGGHADLFMSSMTQALPLIRDGQLKGLAVTGDTRSEAAPEIPTFAEAGLQGIDVGQWWGIFVPAGTPDEIVAKLNDDINTVLQTEETKTFLAGEGAVPTPMEEGAFAAHVQEELQKWAAIAQEANIKAQ
jgi:tripartite-type tricarboxylate transporter receptor subunit TctC